MIPSLFFKRARFIFLVLVIMLGAIDLKLVYNTIIIQDTLKQKATSLWNRSFPLQGERGLIYDINNIPLVENKATLSLYSVPSQIKNKEETSRLLSNIIKMDEKKILEKLKKKTSMVSFYPHGMDLDVNKAYEIEKLGIEGLYLIDDFKRNYPYSPSISSLLGFCGSENTGLAGVEYSYNKYLESKKGSLDVMMDAKGGLFKNKYYSLKAPTKGLSLRLTLNLDIQNIIEREMENAYIRYSPKEISCLVMNPQNGALYALGNMPSYDNNNFKDADPSIYNHLLPLYNTFEPGSTFKACTFAAAINENLIDIDHDVYYDKGYEIVSGRRIKSWKKGGHGLQTYLEVLQNSSNPGFVEISRKLGTEKMYEYVSRFGFLEKSGIDIPGENKGIFFKKEDFHALECAVTSFGQGISVNALQLVTAFSSLINGGLLFTPHILDSIISQNNETLYTYSPKVRRRTISEETSNTMKRALECVVSKGSGRKAYLDGYRVGGKTGTAQISEGGKYKDGAYILSFIAGAPMSDPKVVVYFSLKEPSSCVQYGGTTVGPIMQNILKDILPLLKIKKDYSGVKKEYTWMDEKTVVVNNYIGFPLNKIKSSSYSFVYYGEGEKCIDQLPRAGEMIKEGGKVVIMLG